MKARELMSTNLVAVPPEPPVTAVAALLASRGISAVPVVDASGAPVGVVTEGDLIRRLAEEMLPLFEAQDVHREALATLSLFVEAARQDQLTVEMTIEAAASLRAVRREIATHVATFPAGVATNSHIGVRRREFT